MGEGHCAVSPITQSTMTVADQTICKSKKSIMDLCQKHILLTVLRSAPVRINQHIHYVHKASGWAALFHVPVVGEFVSKALKGAHYFRTTMTKQTADQKTPRASVTGCQ